uniref:Uncharacterized protein n=1 Tax=Arion vulgaris TaxID=1028688 RepID=A0A0B7AKI0_9EUPU
MYATDAITEKISVLVKCLYNDSFTTFLLSLKVLVVCSSDEKIHQQIMASVTAKGMLATSSFTDWSALPVSAREQLSIDAKIKNTPPTKSTLWNVWPSLGLTIP